MKLVFICKHPQDQWALERKSRGSHPLKSLVCSLNIIKKSRSLFVIVEI
jgi:hypothetical protein